MAPIKEAQTETGAKCSVAEVWIERLVERARKTRSSNPEITVQALREDGLNWLHSQPGDKMTATLLIPGREAPIIRTHC